MPNYLSTQAAKIYDGVSSVDTPKPKIQDQIKSYEAGGVAGSMTVDWTIDAGAAAGEKVYLGILKAGWTVDAGSSYLFTAADAGTNVEIDIGFEGIKSTSGVTDDDDAYANNIDISAVGKVLFSSGTAPLALTSPFKLDEDVNIVATYRDGGSFAVNAVKVNGVIKYTA